MNSIRGAIEHTIPISQFNRGLAGQIFEDVRRSGAKVVMKNNIAECVLISPEEYIRLVDELADAQLLAEANQRVADMDKSRLLSQSDVEQALGITPDDYAQVPEVELE